MTEKMPKFGHFTYNLFYNLYNFLYKNDRILFLLFTFKIRSFYRERETDVIKIFLK